MSDEDKKTEDKKTKPKKNTMDITLINSAGDKITATGSCSDKEIKAICKAIAHSVEQKIGIKKPT